MGTKNFYEKLTSQSRTKVEIVSSYFEAWAKVITRQKPTGDIAYLDLFAGQGCYQDGTPSTPLLILNNAVSDQQLRSRLITLFNDKDKKKARCLSDNIARLPGIDLLSHSPRVQSREVGSQITDLIDQLRPAPTLAFLDPWGYRGLSLDLVNKTIRGWACECIFFFNYNRINPALVNAGVECRMDDLFGKSRADSLRQCLPMMCPTDREHAILREMRSALKQRYGKYVLTFCFKTNGGARTSHYLIFVTKNFTGYRIMKDVMARHSSSQVDGVPSFEYSPLLEKRGMVQLGIEQPLLSLADSLLQTFAGQKRTVKQIYEVHSPETPYVEANYKRVLKQLEAQDKIVAVPPACLRMRGGTVTLNESVEIVFPPRKV